MPRAEPAAHLPEEHGIDSNPAVPGVHANGITSRMLTTPVTNISRCSKPTPKPECGNGP